jgi:D-sedoheptulose 7-phosphate isomerase
MNIDLIAHEISESIRAKQRLLEAPALLLQVSQLANDCVASLRQGGKIIFCGNGGSFADAQHLAAEFTSRFLFDRPALASIALGTNSSGMTAMGNDYGFEFVFAREIQALARAEDIFIGITTSGNSPNILNATNVAQGIGLKTYIFTGEIGGKIKDRSECLHVPSKDTARIQECHILIGHIICGIVEKEMFGKKTV